MDSTKKVHFEDNNEDINCSNQDIEKLFASTKSSKSGKFNDLQKRPSFQKIRSFHSLEPSKKKDPLVIKEDHRLDLKNKSLTELKELYEKYENLKKNKKLLSKLPDKGEKTLKLAEKIKQHIKYREDLDYISLKTEELSIKQEPQEDEKEGCSPKKPNVDLYCHQRVRKLEKPSPTNKRFNQPIKSETKVKIESRINEPKEVQIKFELPKEVKTLGYEESLQQLNDAKEKYRKVQYLMFYDYRTRDNEPGTSDEESSNSDSEYDEDDENDSICVNLVTYRP